MRHLAIPLTVTVTLAIAVTLFHFKQQVGDLEKELARVNRTIVVHRETIQVMQTEWSFLNRPERIAELAEKHLGMRRGAPDRLIRLEDLPRRGASGDTDRAAASTVVAARPGAAAREKGDLQ